MSTELQSAYDDAMKRIRGSICTQWADPIEAYVKELQEAHDNYLDDISDLERDLDECQSDLSDCTDS